ncbi:MAG: ribose 5-phosphate isomerase A [Candidatus Diapherotrites archaeon]|nr:ribose 5-phosphate isomerase A [Candidatus Diapherotrites archaeon]
MINEDRLEEFAAKYLKKDKVIAVGSDSLGEKLLKKIALKNHELELNIHVVPTSTSIAALCSQMHLQIANINDREVDIAFELADQADKNFNFVKRNSHSLVRDKMICQSAEELIVLCDEKNFVERVHGTIPFEISSFGWKRTLMQLQKLGKASIRIAKNDYFKTETGHLLVDVDFDSIFSLEDLEFQTRTIAGVLETGLFIGYADRIVLCGEKKIEVKSVIQQK